MLKLPLIHLAFGLTFAMISGAFGQGGINYNPNPSSPALNSGGLAMPGQNPDAAKSGNTGKDDEDDPNLQRLKSSDSMGEMQRDEGQLTAKVRRREKISHVDSTKQLPTTGSDPKFQTNLLHSSVSSITDIGEKANTAASGANSAEAEPDAAANDEDDLRFKAKRLVFTPTTNDEPKAKQSSETKADSSPSPSPSPSASATPSSH